MEHLSQFIINHWLLWLAFIFLLLLTFFNELLSQRKKAKEISPQAAITMLNNEEAIIIDLRDKESFKNGHIIHSINASADDFAQNHMNKYKEKNIVLLCARGLQSSAVADKIRAYGYQPFVLRGGMDAWKGEGLPLVKGK
jgi:rhodanese-related sulfurtransferase